MPETPVGPAQGLSLDDLRARLPLLQAIAAELRDRVEAMPAPEDRREGAARTEALRLRERIVCCMQELLALGAEIHSLRPLELGFRVHDDAGGVRRLRWTGEGGLLEIETRA